MTINLTIKEAEKMLEEKDKEIKRLKEDLRSTVGGRAAAGLALAGQNIKLSNENERLEKTLEIIRGNIFDRGWINLKSFDEIVQALKEGE